MKNRMDIKEAEDYLNGIPKFSKKTTMENERKILALLGHPERGQRFIHVAGTNGKGSVCAFLSRILLEQGHHVGTFISPHLVDITERFLIDGEQASEEEFLVAFHQVYDLCQEREGEIVHPSYFEFLFLIGMLIFRERQVDVTVLEVGLGGRLDATNVIEAPRACVIASVSLDHTEILGDTVSQIAGEKAGIIKAGCPVVYDDSVPEASAVIQKTAERNEAFACPVNPSDFEIVERTGSGLTFQMKKAPFAGENFQVPFVADYQAMNASLAVWAAWLLRDHTPAASTWTKGVRRALLHTSWPGRMEPVCPGIYMDGAHNDDGIRVFIEAVTKLSCTGKKYLLFSAVMEKDYETMIDEICRQADFDGFILTKLDSYRALPLKEILEAFEKRTKKPIWSFDHIREAFAFAREKKGEDDLLFIAGSLYLAGSIKELLREENRDSQA
ncbi:MAG: bifunctional folylpolyglutamate synthase/dihydrofolate synthase [Lachnospiraceae bacterium]|nr:bifunctional folylpolyglutamate synthase/dihydrofolate synthase [Lachnospiraceae bacterium]